jgi:hypothetical protein
MKWLKQRFCRHRLALEDLHLTGIKPPEKPNRLAPYDDWRDYWDEYWHGEWVKKRVAWPCDRCGEVFYAHCGLDLYGKGRVYWRDKLG